MAQIAVAMLGVHEMLLRQLLEFSTAVDCRVVLAQAEVEQQRDGI